MNKKQMAFMKELSQKTLEEVTALRDSIITDENVNEQSKRYLALGKRFVFGSLDDGLQYEVRDEKGCGRYLVLTGVAFHGTCPKEIFSAADMVDERAFFGKEKLEKVYLPLCKKIGNKAFGNCGNLKEVKAPECTETGSESFKGCTNLKKVTVKPGTDLSKSGFCS